MTMSSIKAVLMLTQVVLFSHIINKQQTIKDLQSSSVDYSSRLMTATQYIAIITSMGNEKREIQDATAWSGPTEGNSTF